MGLRLLFGADPELFIRNKKTGAFISAHDLIPGSKLEPFKVDLGAVQPDGVAAEFNIDPTETAQAFTTNIAAVMGKLQSYIGADHELVSQPTCTFPEEYFKSLPPVVRELGCNPDFNAWTGQVNERPDGDSTTMRTAAGHIHIGWTEKADPTDSTHFDDCRIIAKQMDAYLGMYSLMWDEDTKRRSLYGKAGSFRPKPYGMEYRPLSNVWLRTKSLQTWVWNAAYRGCVDLIQSGKRVEDTLGDIPREFIDNNIQWWKKNEIGSDDRRKLAHTLPNFTELANPPPLPKPEDAKLVTAASSKKKATLDIETMPTFRSGDDPSWMTHLWKMKDSNGTARHILKDKGYLPADYEPKG